MFRATFPLAALLALVAALRADPVEMEAKLRNLPPGTALLAPAAPLTQTGQGGTIERVTVEGQPFPESIRAHSAQRPASAYQLHLNAKVIATVKKGDSLLAVLFARAVEMPKGEYEARSEFVFELGRDPYTKSANFPLLIGPQWQKFYIPFAAVGDYEAGEASVRLWLGYDPQIIEIAGLAVTDYGNAVKVHELPYTPATYRGREPDAPWRAEAAERIEKYRKGNLTIAVVDGAGQPKPGAEVHVKMQRHAYGFGSAITADLLFQQSADADRYRDIIARDFNKVVIENHLKWVQWEHDRETGPRAVAWLRGAGLDVRGHVLVWPGKKNLPKSLLPLFEKPEALRPAILNHIADEAGFFRGQFVEWDVVNEPFTNFDVQKVLGDAVLADWFRAARAADPEVKLDINDYSSLSTGGCDYPHQDHYFKTIREIIDAGGPLEGIGMQGHFNEDLTPIPRLAEILDRFATFGRPIQVTEFDVDTLDESLQADYTRDYMTLVFSHPSTIGILTWGFLEKAHWIPNAAFYRADWSLRPAGAAWYDLVFKQWWTPEQRGVADSHGEFKMRGFHGDYVVEVVVGDQIARKTVHLTGAENRVKITGP